MTTALATPYTPPARQVKLFSLTQDSPFRPPSWRWQRADWMIKTGRRPNRYKDDAATFAAFRLKGELLACRDEVDHAELADARPDVFSAWALTRDAYTGDNRRADVEARLLSGQSYAEIADRLCFTEGAIRLFEEIFFHVTDRLTKSGWVIHEVFGADYHEGLSARDYTLLWKVYGYFGGPAVLDLYIARQGMTKASTPGQAIDSINADKKVLQTLNSALAARTININSMTQLALLDLDLRQQEIDLEAAKAGSGGQAEFVTAMAELVSSVSSALTGGARPTPREGATEMRAGEMLALPGFDWSNQVIPEPEVIAHAAP